MKILLFGKGGQLGWELQRSLSCLGELVALDRHSQNLCGDLSNPIGIADAVRRTRPDVIVNAAAYTAVDNAESEADLARTVNAFSPKALAEMAQKTGAWLIHYSTDYVFDGSGTKPWVEGDPTGPLNVYGQTKLEGEQYVADLCEKHLVFRTSWVYAARGANFAKKMLALAYERDSLRVINDQFGAPTGADLIADVTAHVVRHATMQRVSSVAGKYHLAASGETSWHGYAQDVVDFASTAGLPIKVQKDAVQPVPTAAFPTPATRPGNSRLDTAKLRRTFGVELPHWKLGVARMLTEITDQ